MPSPEAGGEAAAAPEAGGAEEPLLAAPGGAPGGGGGELPSPGETPLQEEEMDEFKIRNGRKVRKVVSPSGSWNYYSDKPRNKGSVARKKNITSVHTPESVFGKTRRSVDGLDGLTGLARGAVFEGKTTNYSEEEADVFRTEKEISRLLESLEKKK